MLAGTVLYIRLLVYVGLSLFIKSGLYVYMVVCIVYAYNLTIFIDCKLLGRHLSRIKVDDISDHLPTILVLDHLVPKTNETIKIQCRDMQDCTFNRINAELSGITWEIIITENVNTSFNTFHDILCNTIDKHLPLSQKAVNITKFWREPWVSRGLQKCIGRQKLLYQNSIKIGALQSDILKYKNY